MEQEPGHDLRCVHVDPNSAVATFIASWLTSQGIPARVMNEDALGFEGVTSVASNMGYRGTEVWVDDVAQADQARQLFAEKEAEIRAAHSASLGPVEVACDACGVRSTFAAEMRGTVQECPSCKEYIDVPGVGENWDEAEIESAAEDE